MMENKMLVIEDLDKNKDERFFRMDANSKVTIKRRFQFEETKILYIEYETKQ